MVAALQATFDEQSGQFVIHTPQDTASKFWIGGAAQHGKVHVMATLNFHGASSGQHPAFNILEGCVLWGTGLEQLSWHVWGLQLTGIVWHHRCAQCLRS